MAELRKRGLITAVICSDPFLKLGRAQARTFGVPDLPMLLIPHPLGGIKIDEVGVRAERAVEQLLALVGEQAK